MGIPESLFAKQMNGVRAWEINVADSPYAQSIATVQPNSYAEFTEEDAARFAKLIAALPSLIEASRPIAGCVFGFGGEDHDYISVSAGELRALAEAVARADGGTT